MWSNIKCFIDGEKFSHFGRDLAKWLQTEHIHWSCGDTRTRPGPVLAVTMLHAQLWYRDIISRIMSHVVRQQQATPAPPHLMLWHRGHNHNNLASPQHATCPLIGRCTGGGTLIGCWDGGVHLCAGWWACVEDTEPASASVLPWYWQLTTHQPYHQHIIHW